MQMGTYRQWAPFAITNGEYYDRVRVRDPNPNPNLGLG